MSSSATRSSPPRAGLREWLGLAVLSLPTLLVALDMSVLFLALPHLTAALGATSVELLWITDVYSFAIAGFLLTAGTVGDRIGHRRLLLIGAAGFGAASVLAAFSTSAGMLIAARAVLGAVAATLMPSTLALISKMFGDPRQRRIAIAGWSSTFMAGIAIGPVAGGALLEFFWWGSVFLLAVPVMVLLLVAGPALLPEQRAADAGRLDLLSVGLSLATVLPPVHALKELARGGSTTTVVLALLAGLVAGALFVRRQRRLADPLFDLRLFTDRGFSTALLVLLLGAATTSGITMFVAQYLQMADGLSPLRAALWLLPAAAALVASSMLAPVAARWIGPGYVVGAGLLVSSAGFAVLAQVGGPAGPAGVVAGLAIAYFGTGPADVLGTDLAVGAAPPGKAGAAASMSETTTELGVAVGTAGLGSLGALAYRGEMAGSVPAGIAPEAADRATDTMAGAVTAARQLPADLAGELLALARDAYTGGLIAVAAAAATTTAVLAVLAIALLRRRAN
ncbi:MFS transporter, DHA2 family, multidrug resistance protein [Saccharopolyspora kobensis]|uniref:MFS transporter, DHA2 family, multidrug resistance protein n=2 Tax=Saccharopolyspora kobensis TaxID=146035 RepID=A0A1H5ZM76_9PSEU|nr:MFS transporter [Saccharopolyspora kobensis]SEG37663.1 MFS transporter, DHA2 family, multidrug resistance protein [Saccharopolyspora kobensis]SFF21735.1 MFS transporter, DHA2 family, multidrug resistance protein [Saccharopolyspora kobensis]